MTKQCHHHFLVNQEKAEKHVFRKSKKYRTLCSVALGTMVTAVVAWGGQVAQADEVVTPSQGKTVQLTENPATNLPEAQSTPVAEQTNSLASTGQSDGAITVTVPHDVVTQAVNQATAEGVTTVQDQPMDLGNTTSASDTSKQLDKAEADAAKQAEAITQVTNTYKADKAAYEQDKTRVEQRNTELAASHKDATQAGKALNHSVDSTVSKIKGQDQSANVTVTTQTVPSGDGSTVSGYQDYTSAVTAIDKQNKNNLAEYESKKKAADAIVAKNLQIQKENEAGLAKAKADNEAIDKRNQAGQKAVDDENKAGQAAVDTYNKDQQKLVKDREAEIAAITKRNKEKEEAAKKENEAIDTYNTKEMERYKRDLAEISKGEEGYISQALAQALNLNNGEPQARHSADTRNPNRIVAKGDAMLGGYSKILDSSGFFVYNTFKTGETLSFTYQNLQNARFDGKKITKVAYDITNLVSPTGTNAVQLVVPNDPTEGFIAYRNDGTGNWRTDKMEFRVKAKYFLEDGSQVSFTKEKPGVFTHSSLNHNDIGLEYVKDTSGKFVPINGSTIQVTNEGLARSLGSNRASDLNLSEEWDTSYSKYAYKGAIVSTVTSGNTYTVTFGQGDMPQNVGLSYWFALNTLPVARTVKPYSPKPHVTPKLEPVPEPVKVVPKTFTPKTFTPEPPVRFKEKPLEKVTQPSLTLTKVTLPKEPTPEPLPKAPQVPTVHYHDYRLTTTPEIVKEVINTDQVNLHDKTVAKDSTVIYPLTVDAFSPNRAKTTSLTFEDYLPAGYAFDKEKTQAENGNYPLTFDAAKNFVTLTAKEALLQEVNQDLTKSYQLMAPKLYGSLQNDGATYSNSYQLLINKETPNAYTVTSNVVTVRTPGDGTTTSRIEPQKRNENEDGVVINDTVVALGTTNHYRLTWDLDQYKGDRSSKETIARGFFFVDDYPEEVLNLVDQGTGITTPEGKAVSGITVKAYASLSEAPKDLQDKLAHAKISPKGAFQVFMAEDPKDFYDSYVTKGQNITIITPMTVRESMLNSGKSYDNVAYQVDFGQAYETNTVTNHVPKVNPHKSNTNKEGVSIDGKTVLPNTINYYKIVLDYSQYKDLVVTEDVLTKGFYMVDDYPEEALSVNADGVQVMDKAGTLVKGISVKSYASLSEAPKVVQDAMAKRQFTPKGAIQVLSADDPKAFYEAYVKTGQTLVVTLPMTIKNELTKTGGKYENTAYQIDFGLAYVTETVVNNVPKLDPQKDVVIDLSQKEKSLDGKEVALNQVFNYRLVGALIPGNRATPLIEYRFDDDYDESHDDYNGVYKAYTLVDVTLKDGTVLPKGTEVTKYTLQHVDTSKGTVTISFDQEFLEKLAEESEFQADVYVQMKRIASGVVENTVLHTVNGYTISSNTVKTTTPEPEQPTPTQPTPPQPPIPTQEPPVPASVLPNTGESQSLLALVGGGLLLGLAYGLSKLKMEDN
ncbi:SspB-related isopeptide-forming adhesin [Streptococcus canis]|uniref:SspB-related isopeptide-forming adhesin n=1 Tax=Streptococcus canis TaxID=1329 RepID=UPI0012E90B2D|nr:SspB-related isopeptide-forming adhesin [Streptococcus canis]QJD12188.1 LPXTG cell wall anchor domain-containing protein [Streptococcus canis]